MFKNNKKGLGLADAPALIITFVVVGIVATLGLTVLEELQGTQTANGSAYNATGEAISGLESFAGLLPAIGVIVGIVIVLAVIFMLWRPTGGGM